MKNQPLHGVVDSVLQTKATAELEESVLRDLEVSDKSMGELIDESDEETPKDTPNGSVSSATDSPGAESTS